MSTSAKTSLRFQHRVAPGTPVANDEKGARANEFARPEDDQPTSGSSNEYPLLSALLAQKGLRLKGTYTTRDAAEIFGVSVRAIQERVRNGKLPSRDLPGHARFLSEDLEAFLRESSRRSRRVRENR